MAYRCKIYVCLHYTKDKARFFVDISIVFLLRTCVLPNIFYKMAKRKADVNPTDPSQAKKNIFSWTDSEIQLLLETTKDFKAKQEYEGVDWNTIRTRFDKIKDAFINSYPS